MTKNKFTDPFHTAFLEAAALSLIPIPVEKNYIGPSQTELALSISVLRQAVSDGRAAVFIIDVQEEFLTAGTDEEEGKLLALDQWIGYSRGKTPISYTSKDYHRGRLIRDIKRLMSVSRGKIPIVHIAMGKSEAIYSPHFLARHGAKDTADGKAQLDSPLCYPISKQDYLVVKQEASPFTGKKIVDENSPMAMNAFVKARGWDTIILTGLYADMCLLQTAGPAKLNGNNVFFVSDVMRSRMRQFHSFARRHSFYQQVFNKLGTVMRLEAYAELFKSLPVSPLRANQSARLSTPIND